MWLDRLLMVAGGVDPGKLPRRAAAGGSGQMERRQARVWRGHSANGCLRPPYATADSYPSPTWIGAGDEVRLPCIYESGPAF